MTVPASATRRPLDRRLVVIGWAVFLGSLLLPAIQVQVPRFLGVRLDYDETYSGWQAATVALRALRDLGENHDVFFLCLAGLGNVGLLFSPLCLLGRGRLPNRMLGVLLLVAVVSGLIAGWQIGIETIRVGFFAWVAAYLLVIAGLGSRGRGRGDFATA
ncbi:MAG TPA: hypothetical protein VJV75_07155 [Candidatus Polarisedimenticolia bacterium]|nr:hypothetical protein [Candidatus Polarisedimenticolia bacterium]